MEITHDHMNEIENLGAKLSKQLDDGRDPDVSYPAWVLRRVLDWETSPDGALTLDNLEQFYPMRHYVRDIAERREDS